MRRRTLLAFLSVASASMLGAEPPSQALRGKLAPGATINLADGRVVKLQGDEPTLLVLNDKRIIGSDFEVMGHPVSPGVFQVDPIHTRSLFAYKDGKRLMVTYWCDVCYIRTYSPGKCICCQKYTDLDLVDPDTVEKK